jgi:hypothetical protein
MPKQKKKEPLPRSSHILQKDLDLGSYENDYLFKTTGTPTTPKGVRTTAELCAYLENNKDTELEARTICYSKDDNRFFKSDISKKTFLEQFKSNNRLTARSPKFRECFSKLREQDAFALGANATTNPNNYGYSYANSGLIGDDFYPLLGGPFYKQLYYYNDYLTANSAAFFAYHHDPIARGLIDITANFVVGRGFRFDCDNDIAMALWKAFEEANDLQNRVYVMCKELSIYGEVMPWWLPDNNIYVTYRPTKGQAVPKGVIPRIRSLDPTNINEIVTAPEDIENVFFYVWINPTQYQIFTSNKDGSTVVPVSKFIYDQLPADQVQHYKINCVSNEKRGRSDLYPILGYLKRLRDSVNYALVGMQKASAWSIDTTIEGDEADLQSYANDQAALGTYPPAGSEYVHTKAIERKYLGNKGDSAKENPVFNWALNMVCAGYGVPVSYLGTHLSGGSTRASALVATEPVAKRMQMRQRILEIIMRDMAKKLFTKFGIEAAYEFTFPEIITQDSSQKIKDIYLCEEANWISPERAATMASKELNITEFDYDSEKEKIKEQRPDIPGVISGDVPPPPKPLTSPGAANSDNDTGKPSAVTSQDRKQVSDNYGF